MFGELKKRRKNPFQADEEVTIPLNAVSGSGSPYDPILASQYEMPNGQARPQVDPIQVGPTG